MFVAYKLDTLIYAQKHPAQKAAVGAGTKLKLKK